MVFRACTYVRCFTEEARLRVIVVLCCGSVVFCFISCCAMFCFVIHVCYAPGTCSLPRVFFGPCVLISPIFDQSLVYCCVCFFRCYVPVPLCSVIHLFILWRSRQWQQARAAVHLGRRAAPAPREGDHLGRHLVHRVVADRV